MKRALALSIGVVICSTWASAQAKTLPRSSHAAVHGKIYSGSQSKSATAAKPSTNVRTGRTAKSRKVHGPSVSSKSSTATQHAGSLRYNLNRKPVATGQLPGSSYGSGTAHTTGAGTVGLKDTLRAAATAAQQRHKSMVGTGQPVTSGQPGAFTVGRPGVTEQISKPSGALQTITNPPEPLRDNSRPVQTGNAGGASSSSPNSGQPGVLTVGETGGPSPTQQAKSQSQLPGHPSALMGSVAGRVSSGSGQPGALTVGRTGGPPSTQTSSAPSSGSGQPGASTVGQTGGVTTAPTSTMPSGPLPPFGTVGPVVGAVAPGARTVGNTGVVTVPPPAPEPIREKPRNPAQSGTAANSSAPAPALGQPGAATVGRTGMLTPPPAAAFDPLTDTPQPVPSATPTNLPPALQGLSGVTDKAGYPSLTPVVNNNPNIGLKCYLQVPKKSDDGFSLGDALAVGAGIATGGIAGGELAAGIDILGHGTSLDPRGHTCVRMIDQICDLHDKGGWDWVDRNGDKHEAVDGIDWGKDGAVTKSTYLYSRITNFPDGSLGNSVGWLCVADPRVTDLPPPGDPNRGVMCGVTITSDGGTNGTCVAYAWDQPCNLALANKINFSVDAGPYRMQCVPNPICSDVNAFPQMVGALSNLGGAGIGLKSLSEQCGRASVCTDEMFGAVSKLDHASDLNQFAKLCMRSLPPTMTLDQYCSVQLPAVYGIASLQQTGCAVARKMALADFCALPASTGAGVEMAQREVCASPVGGWH